MLALQLSLNGYEKRRYLLALVVRIVGIAEIENQAGYSLQIN
jgi:hypothetical protein